MKFNWKQAVFGAIETAIDIGASLIPGGSIAKKVAKKSIKGLARGVGFTKDLFNTGGDIGDPSKNFGEDLKKGLDDAKSQIESQGKALQGAIDGVKSELQGQLQQQGAKFEQEIKALDAKIANATGEIKIQLEQEKKERERQIQQLQVLLTK